MKNCAIALVLAACGGAPTWPEDPQLDNLTTLEVTPEARDYAKRGDIKSRVRDVMEETATFYGRDITALRGWRIVLTGPLTCGYPYQVGGCASWGDKTIYVDTYQTCCLGLSVLPHELLHVLRGDGVHDHEEFDRLPELWRQLSYGRDQDCMHAACY